MRGRATGHLASQLERAFVPCTQNRLAIRAAKSGPEADFLVRTLGKKTPCGTSAIEKKRGSFEGAIRIPSRASSFLFNDLVFLRIPRKSLKFHSALFSIPTAPTNLLKYQYRM